MYTSKTIVLTASGIVTIAIMLLIIQVILNKIKSKTEQDGRFKISFGVWFSTLFVSASVIGAKAVTILSQAIDNVYKNISSNVLGEVAKTTSLFIGLSAFWFVVWYYVASLLSVIIVGKRKDQNEIDADNVSYFLIKGVLVIAFALCLLPVFEIILRTFMPNIDIPFYH